MVTVSGRTENMDADLVVVSTDDTATYSYVHERDLRRNYTLITDE
ncbi:MAG: hypothetical protein AAFP84_20860 [Actinomycetota bacterium]